VSAAYVAAESGRGSTLVPAGLLALSAIPILAGAFRLSQFAGIAPSSGVGAGFAIPVTVHILSVTVFAILGAFQFSSGFRRRRPGWHRVAGRIVVGAGAIAGLSGLWLTLYAGWSSGELLFLVRLLFGTAMVVSIGLGFRAIRRGQVGRHRAWMIRAYAIGLGAGTQVLTQMVGELALGKPEELGRALFMAAGWVINVAVAEWAIRRRSTAVALGSVVVRRGGAL
jgi:uncharacterized membrane protein